MDTVKVLIRVGPAATLTALCWAPSEAEAQFHWLFDPTPREEMRELSTDRPDTTESAYSVDPGHTQIETEILSGELGYDGRWRGETLMETNAKLGLTPFADLQVVFTTFEEGVDVDGNHEGGMGDTAMRLKINLFGNDGGDVAIALLPFVTLPTGHGSVTAGQAQYGLAIPVAVGLPEGFGLSFQLEGDLVSDVSGPYHGELLTTVSVGHELVGPLAAFVELTNNVVFDSVVEAQGTVNGGLTLGFDDAIQLDAGLNLRTWGNAPSDVRLFLGATVRQ
ncbi:MAG: transporter [Sandaracinaceae bacterium]|nr:transporter [Sandaracinaceae bacterium]